MLTRIITILTRSSSVELHPYLVRNLQLQSLYPPNEMQQKALTASLTKNVFINSCTGSGKTLAYLLPILNSILHDKDSNVNSTIHGAVILTLNKELSMQIYRQIRVLDPQNRIRTFRTGSIAHYSPIVSQLSQKDHNPDEIMERMNSNIAQSIQWGKMDILVSTPQMLVNILKHYQPPASKLTPKAIAIDQADLVMEIDKNVAKHTFELLRYVKDAIQERVKEGEGEMDKEMDKEINHKEMQRRREGKQSNNDFIPSSYIKYFIAASSFPVKMKKIPAKQALHKYFSPIEVLTFQSTHKLPPTIDLLYIQLENTQDQPLFQQKLQYLSKLISTGKEQKERMMIFVNSKEKMNIIKQRIEQAEVKAECYLAQLKTEQRADILLRFHRNEVRVLICSDLASRGLDFPMQPIHTILEFDPAQNITTFINRAGRTGRNGLPGRVITFVQPKNKVMWSHMMQVKNNDEGFDQLFSRKRSYRKLYKPKNNQSELIAEAEAEDNNNNTDSNENK